MYFLSNVFPVKYCLSAMICKDLLEKPTEQSRARLQSPITFTLLLSHFYMSVKKTKQTSLFFLLLLPL